MLQFRAYDEAADAWTDILGVAHQRETIRRAWELHVYRGSEEALHRFADMAGFSVAVQYTASGSPARNTSVAMSIVSPPVDRAADAQWIAYITRVIRGRGVTLRPVALDADPQQRLCGERCHVGGILRAGS